MAVRRVDLAFGRRRKESFEQKLSKADKDAFAANFPEKFDITLPWWGKQTYELRKAVRALLDELPYPTFKPTFAVEGDCKAEGNVTIECTRQRMTGTDHGNFQILGLGVSYEFQAEVEDGDYERADCPCSDGKKGWLRQRNFEVEWYLRLDMNPGIGGSYPLETQDVLVRAPCCCPEGSTPTVVTRRTTRNARKTRGSRAAA
jgi:hypothetical protein